MDDRKDVERQNGDPDDRHVSEFPETKLNRRLPECRDGQKTAKHEGLHPCGMQASSLN
jgi:hypothetical protein